MNDVYTADRNARNSADYEGSGVGSGRYDEAAEKKERVKELKLPLILLAFATLCLIVLIYLSGSEFIHYSQGTAITGTANSNANYASFVAPDNHTYTVAAPFSGLKADQNVTIYYLNNDYNGAQIMTNFSWWAAMYAFFLIVFAFIGRWIYKTLHKTSHAQTSEAMRHEY